MSDHSHATFRSITKSVRIDCDPKAAFAYLSDPGNWAQWAIVNVKSTRRTDDPEWWDMVTPRGAARLRLRADGRHGILDQISSTRRRAGPCMRAWSATAAAPSS